MELAYSLFTFTVEVLIVSFILVAAFAIYYDFAYSEIPPGVEQPRKLRILHCLLIMSMILGKILERLGFYSEINFIRYAQERKNLGKDPKLFIQDLQFEEVPVRIYQPSALTAGQRRGLIYLHGGGWMFGSINSYDRICRYLAKESETVVLSVGYRLAPEQKYPSQFRDCLTASVHFMRTAEDYGVDSARIIISGDSVGGTLAAAVCHALVCRTDLPKPLAQILIYPGLQAIDFYLPSYQQNHAVPILYREQVIGCCLQYLEVDSSALKNVIEGSHVPLDMKLKYGRWINPDRIPEEFKNRGYKPHLSTSYLDEVHEVVKQALEPTFSPLLTEDSIVSRLPMSYILTCEYDVLRDDGLLYKKRLEDSGVPVTWYHIKEGFHGVLYLFDYGILSFPSGKKAVDDIVNFLKSL
ncbi:arylacetamide deacetylase-like 4 [Emydura macquarii macquarii]|uniref:arylacetamide deacetylase-like 4 n=1 Tax=Emydura macquarii macquarii TaxID=1129001 RepID=UPI00352BB7ED